MRPGSPLAAAVRLPVYLLSTTLCVLWSFYAGKDVSWDFMHYHVHAGLSALNDRFAQDFMAAGPQSYFNPYAYVPAYWLALTSWPPAVAAGTWAALQSVIVWLAFELGLELQRGSGAPVRWTPVLMGTVLALCSPLLLAQLGTGYADISTGALVLGGVVAFVRATRMAGVRAPRWDALAGALIGAATALKLSNAIFGVAVALALVLTAGGLRRLLPRAGAYAAAGVGAWVVVSAPWSLRLWLHFGNPLFPFFNSWFGSDAYSTDTAGRHLRFVPTDAMDALLRPLRMALPDAGVYVETPLPDVRFAALLLAGLVGVGTWMWARRLPSRPTEAASSASNGFTALWCAFVFAWALWLWSSGNGRYLAPMTLAAGPLLAETWHRAVRGHPKAYWYGMLLVLALHGGGLLMGSKLRWASGAWGEQWLKASIPQRAVEVPYLYLGTDMISASVLAPYVHPGSGFVHVAGQSPLDRVGPGSRQLQERLTRYDGRVRAVMMGTTPPQPQDLARIATELDQRIARLGLQVDPQDCLAFKVETRPGMPKPSGDEASAVDRWEPPAYLTACLTQPAPHKRQAFLDRARQADQVFADLERRCPRLFHPPHAVTEYGGTEVLWRYYSSTDVRLALYGDEIRYIDSYRLGPAITLGSIKTWLAGKGKVNCELRYVPVRMAQMIQPKPAARGGSSPAAAVPGAAASK